MKIKLNTTRKIMSLLLSGGNSLRGIADLTAVSHQSVMRMRDKLRDLQITYDELKSFDDIELERRLTKKVYQKKDIGDWVNWVAIHDAHKIKRIPLVTLWTELMQMNSNSDCKNLSIDQFRRSYKKWFKKQNISMRQIHTPGEKVFIDFCGQTVPIYNSTDGCGITKAQIFVAVLGGSGLIFAYAVESQASSDWLKCHVEMFNYFGGVPKYLVSDNLKSAITKHTSEGIIINRAYQELADHYDTVILPARVRRPKDKSLVEIAVRIIQSGMLWSIRNFKFSTLNDLNEEIKSRLEFINNKITKTYKESRRVRFLNIEKSELQELPSQEYQLGDWYYNKKIDSNYHFDFCGRLFSVPHSYFNSHVDLKITPNNIEIFNGGKRIAVKSLDPSISGTDPSHMPPGHKDYLDSSTTDYLDWSSLIGVAIHQWCKHHLENKKNFANGIKAVSKLKKLVAIEKDNLKIEACCAFAISLNSFSFTYLNEVVKQNLHTKVAPTKTAWIKDHENLRGSSNYSDIGAKS
jgi:transposase